MKKGLLFYFLAVLRDTRYLDLFETLIFGLMKIDFNLKTLDLCLVSIIWQYIFYGLQGLVI